MHATSFSMNEKRACRKRRNTLLVWPREDKIRHRKIFRTTIRQPERWTGRVIPASIKRRRLSIPKNMICVICGEYSRSFRLVSFPGSLLSKNGEHTRVIQDSELFRFGRRKRRSQYINIYQHVSTTRRPPEACNRSGRAAKLCVENMFAASDVARFYRRYLT